MVWQVRQSTLCVRSGAHLPVLCFAALTSTCSTEDVGGLDLSLNLSAAAHCLSEKQEKTAHNSKSSHVLASDLLGRDGICRA